jgi:hypothetical protein
LAWVGARVTVCLDIYHVWESASVLGYFFNVNGACDVETTVAYVDADARLLRLG